MMGAILASQEGAKTCLIEANENLGKKLLISGGGRCNLANFEKDIKKLMEKYGSNGGFLYHALHEFGPEKTIGFFENRGVKTRIEENNRVFPKSGKSKDILEVLQNELRKNNVEIIFNATVIGLNKVKDKIASVEIISGDKNDFVFADSFIVACGGKSYPQTGSNGSFYAILEKLGHKIMAPKPALAPLLSNDKSCQALQGLSVKNVGLKVFAESKRKFEAFGDIIFTHFGLSGPGILNISRKVADLPEPKMLKLDFFPHKNQEEILAKIRNLCQINGSKDIKNCFENFLPQRLIEEMLFMAMVPLGKKCAELKNEERAKIALLSRDFPVSIQGIKDFDEAMSTRGGISLKEVDAKTMRSGIFSNLYFAGEILDIDGPTGGYNMQVAWSTGYLAGKSASSK